MQYKDFVHKFIISQNFHMVCIIYLRTVVIAVIFYHLGCYAEYKLGIEDTARVVPVHGVWYVHFYNRKIVHIS